MRTAGARCDVADVIVNDQFAGRSSRTPDFAAEAAALGSLAEAIGIDPTTVALRLVELMLELTQCDSAGLCVSEPSGEPAGFRWIATAGAWAPHQGGVMAPGESPCDEVIARDAVLLVRAPERAFPAMRQLQPEIAEGLLAPFQIGGMPAGTLWAVMHRPESRFEAEDVRLLKNLARFASAAQQMTAVQVATRSGAWENEARYRTLFDRMDQGFCIIQKLATMPGAPSSYRCLTANPAFERHSGLQNVVGKTIAELLPNAAQGFLDIYDEVLRTGEHRRFERRAAGTDTWTNTEAFLTETPGQVAVLLRNVSKRKAAEAALRQSEARYRTLFETMGQGYALIELCRDAAGNAVDMRFVALNPAVERLVGTTAAALIGKLATEVFPGIQPVWWETYDKVVQSGEPVRFEQYFAPSERWYEVYAYPADGDRVVALFEDFTSRKHATDALRDSEERFRQFSEASASILWIRDAITLRMVFASPAFDAIYGMPGPAHGGNDRFMTWARLIVPQYRAAVIENFRRLRAGERREHKFQIRRASDGARRWIHNTDFPLCDAGGTVRWIAGLGADVTARKEAEARRLALVELSDRVRDARDPDDLAYAAVEVLGRTLNVSRAGYGMIDIVADTIDIKRDWQAPGIGTLAGVWQLRDYGSHIDDLKRGREVVIADTRQDPRTAPFAGALAGLDIQAVVNVPVGGQGRFVPLLYLNCDVPRSWSDDDIIMIREFAERTRTVMERLNAEADLKELTRTLEQQVAERTADRDRLWRGSQELLIIARFDGAVVAVNPAWTAVLGWSETELVGASFWDLIHPDDLPATRAHAVALTTGGEASARFDCRYRAKNDTWHWLAWSVASGAGHFDGVARDITEDRRRQAELEVTQNALRQSQKMEAMGSLTGGVAHDFNNLLTPIVGTLDMLQRKGIGGEREQRLIAGAIQSADRAKVLVQRLLAFARRQPLQSTSVDVALLVRGMADLVASTIGPQFDVVVVAPDGLPPAQVDSNQLEMAILNLAVNARDAMVDGGTLRISVDVETSAAGNSANLAPGPYLRLSVTDSGGGMDEATLNRAIEPFFSTKGIGKGTGLGLSMVHGLASQLGGALTIHSMIGVGTNVTLWLPPSSEAPSSTGANGDPAASVAGSGTALLVDDEELVRLNTADMLTDLGYIVVEASSAVAALELIEAGLRPDLLVTDHLMHGMSGTELAGQLQVKLPDIKVLVISGYAEVEGIAPGLCRLEKPFRQTDLAGAIGALGTST